MEGAQCNKSEKAEFRLTSSSVVFLFMRMVKFNKVKIAGMQSIKML